MPTIYYGWDVPSDDDYVKDTAAYMRTLGNDIDATLWDINAGTNKNGLYNLYFQSFTNVSTLNIDNIFTGSIPNYKIILTFTKTTTGNIATQLRASGASIGGIAYRQQSNRSYGATTDAVAYSASNSRWEALTAVGNGQQSFMEFEIFNPALASSTFMTGRTFAYDGTNFVGGSTHGGEYTAAVRDGISFINSSGTFTGQIAIYGYRNN